MNFEWLIWVRLRLLSQAETITTYCVHFATFWKRRFLTAVLHRGLRNCFFSFYTLSFTFHILFQLFYPWPFLFGLLLLFLFGLLFPFFIWIFIFQFFFTFFSIFFSIFFQFYLVFVSAWLSTYYLVSQTHRKISTCTKSDEKWVEIHPRSGLSFLTNSAFFGGIPAPGQSQHPAGKGFVGKKNPKTVSIQEGSRIKKHALN